MLQNSEKLLGFQETIQYLRLIDSMIEIYTSLIFFGTKPNGDYHHILKHQTKAEYGNLVLLL